MSPPPLATPARGALLVSVGVEAMRRAGLTRPNWRGREVAFPGGLAVMGAGVAGLVLAAPRGLAPAREAARRAPRSLETPAPRALPPGAAAFPLGVGLLGLLDDLWGGDGPRGVRGHLAAACSGRPSTGVAKAAGTLLLAPLALPRGEPWPDRAPALFVLALAAHAANLIDLRPGRALKALALLGAGLAARTRRPPPPPLPALLVPCAAFLPFDLRERAMLGDTGSGLVGALAGMWLVHALGRAGRAGWAAVLAALAGYAEIASVSARVERTPGLRHLDSIGRAHA